VRRGHHHRAGPAGRQRGHVDPEVVDRHPDRRRARQNSRTHRGARLVVAVAGVLEGHPPDAELAQHLQDQVEPLGETGADDEVLRVAAAARTRRRYAASTSRSAALPRGSP
jgi:hypothetical protein